MSRGLLDDATLEQIDQRLPDLTPVTDLVRRLLPDHLSIKFSPESDIPIAAVCLRDAVDVLEQAHYALHEVYAHQIWYREKRASPSEAAAVFHGQFYAQDLAFRLYSAAEHVADGIIMMLGITDTDLKSFRHTKRVSQALVVGHYLLQQRKDEPITAAIRPLSRLSAWDQTTKYRNDLVHAQPPTVAGLGNVYKRARRWRTIAATPTNVAQHVLDLGGGDMPEYTLDDILAFLEPSFVTLVAVTHAVAEFYVVLLDKHGFRMTAGGVSFLL